MSNIINLTANTTINLDNFRSVLFSSMNEEFEEAFKYFASKRYAYERADVIMSTGVNVYKYIFGMQALLFSIPEYDLLSNDGQLAYGEMKEVLEGIIEEMVDLAHEIKL